MDKTRKQGSGLLLLSLLLLSQSAQQGTCKMTEVRLPRTTATALDGQVEIALEIDRLEYSSDPANISLVRAKFTVRNLTGQAIPFRFASGQITDWTLVDSTGKQLWKWSDGRIFTSISGERLLESTPWEFEDEIPLSSEDNKPFPPGNYTLKADLAADKKLQVSISFRIIP